MHRLCYGKGENSANVRDEAFGQPSRKRPFVSLSALSAPGTGKHHEVVLLQKILDWDRFAHLITRGETGQQAGGWMVEGLKYRDRWESKLLRCARWSPRQ